MKTLLALLWLALLAGCGGIELRPGEAGMFSIGRHAPIAADLRASLAGASPCCPSLAELPHGNLAGAGETSLSIGTGSPAFDFDTGKSFFAAYRISDLPRPFVLELASYRTAEPGSLGKIIPDLRQLVFAPAVLLLDERFRPVRRFEPFVAAGGCASNAWEPVYGLRETIWEAPAQAAYLVVLTTRELLARDGDRICGVVRHGLSPVGDLSLRISTMDFKDGAPELEAAAKWHPGARGGREVGLFAGAFADPGLLLIGASGVHFLERRQHHFASVLDVGYDRIFAAKAMGSGHQRERYLGLGFLDQGKPVYHTFQLEPLPPRAAVPAREIAGRIDTLIVPGRLKEWVAVTVAAGAVPVEFDVPGQGAISRIGDAAVAGGLVTAFPCGICQVGVCTPEVLLPCAALFSVGAVIGGIAGTGKELVLKLTGDSPDLAGAVNRTVRPRLESDDIRRFNGEALRQCVAAELGRPGLGLWRDQGREAAAGLAPDPGSKAGEAMGGAVQGYRLQARLARIALVAEGKAAVSMNTPASLVLEGEVLFGQAAGGEPVLDRVSWKSPGRRLGDWIDAASRLAEESLEEGCRQLAKQIVEAGRKAWSEY